MNPFTYTRATSQGTAIQAIAADQKANFIAGSTNPDRFNERER